MHFSIIYLAAVLPFQFRILSPTIGIIGIMLAWVLGFNSQTRLKLAKKHLPLLMILGLYLLGAISFFYTEDLDNWGRLMTLKLPTLLLPLALGTTLVFDKARLKFYLKTFAFSTALACLILFVIALTKSIQDPGGQYFYHHNFAAFSLIPVHYFAMYCVFSVLVLLYYFPAVKSGSKTLTIIHTLAVLILISTVFIGAARMQVASLFVAITMLITFFWIRKREWKKILIYELGIALILGVLAFGIPSSRQRLIETYREWKVFKGESKDYQTNHRIFIWKHGKTVVQDHLWLGTGLGSADNALHEQLIHEPAEFWERGVPYTLGEFKYNYHNSYLQHLAALGILGFIFLLLALMIPLSQWRQGLFLGSAFLIIMAMGFLTESMLERQAGTLFFAFFFGLLLLNNRNRLLLNS